jgi:class 3 adenylate cyclase/tetratricopeptide (TPR) repeat protein
VRCISCGTDNAADARFCNQCATPLSRACPKCAHLNAPAAKFCSQCAIALGGQAAASSDTSAAPVSRGGVCIAAEPEDASLALGGERKTVTALFADIKGSMDLMEGLDPEEARAIVDPALKLMIDAAHRYDGYVVQSTGDGIFALFGAPVAHEDHPQRALHAARLMQEDLTRHADKLREQGQPPLLVRVGVNTGEVVVRTIQTGDAHTEYTPIGHSISLASRLQTLAAPGSIVIGESVRNFVEGYFQLKALGASRVKGVSEPVNVYEVTGLGPLRTRLQRSAGRGLTKFVGREREIEALKHAADQAKSGHGQIAAAMAEPGLGKSRLFFEFKAMSAADWIVLETVSVSHGKASAYLPVIELLRNYFDISGTDDERKRREKVNGKILTLDRVLEDTVPYLFSLLGIVEGDDPLTQIDGQVKKRRTLDAIKRILLRESLNQPLMVIFEDLHWIDDETQELLNLLADSIGTAKLLLLVNYRPEYSHQWNSKTYYTQLRLDPLGKESAAEMLAALLGDGTDLLPLKRLIIERTEGTPFFMEEIVQALFEDGVLVRNGVVKLAKSMSAVKVPATVQAVLAARIDRLPAEEKELLQTLAVLGREFPLGLVRHVTVKPDDELERMLARLQAGEFIYEQPALGELEYVFKHALTQEVAYNALLVDRRKLLHERAGLALESMFADQLEDHLDELARHYSRSENAAKAVDFLGRAGLAAAQQAAHSEAIGCFTRALELLQQLPDGGSRDRQELELQMALSESSFVAIGLRAFEREPALVRARELSERLGDNLRLMEALLALAHLRFNQRDFGTARELAERVLVMSKEANAPAILAGTHSVLGLVRFATGDFAATRQHCERAVELFAITSPREGGGLFAQIAPNLLLAVVIFLGYPAKALSRAGEQLAAARRSSDPSSLVFALLGDGLNHVWLRDTPMAGMVAQRGEEMLYIATEHAIPLFLILAAFLRGWVMVTAGRAEEGIAEMRRSISDPMIAGATLRAQLLTVLAETCGKNGRVEEGLELVAIGLATAEQTGMTVAEAELHRIKGDLLIATCAGSLAEGERCLRTAIEVSRRQCARLFELRATVSLARLLRQQENTVEARTMLADIYNWFTEGFDTADLQDARILLDELAG